MSQSKIDTILSAIREEAARQQNKIEKQTEQKMKDELARAEAEVLQETYDMIKRRSAVIREEAGRRISESEQETRRSLFARRAEITDEIFSSAAERLKEYVCGEEYPAFLEASAQRLAETAQKGRLILSLRPDDMPHAGHLRALFGADFDLEVQPDPSIRIGGLRADLPEQSLRLDDTLDARLENQREWFMEHSGLTIGDA